MTKLTDIRKALESNPNVVIVSVPSISFLPRGGSYYPKTRRTYRDEFDKWIQSERYLFVVAPKEGLYTVDELQDFMLGLVPKLEPLYKQDFHDSGDRLILGYLGFEEEIAKEKRHVDRKVTLIDTEIESKAFDNGVWTGLEIEDISHIRRIEVRPYPDKTFATRYKNRIYWPPKDISKEDLKKLTTKT